MRHLDGTWNDAAAAVVAALEHRRGDRRVVGVAVLELVVDGDDGSATVVLQHGVASAVAAAPGTVLREFAAALLATAAQEEGRVQ